MAEYVNIKNDQGNIIINDSFNNLRLKRKISLDSLTLTKPSGCDNCATDNSEYEEYSRTFRYFTLDSDEFCFGVTCALKTMNSVNFGVKKANSGDVFAFAYSGDISQIYIYTFTNITPDDTENVGLNIFNSSGKLVFNSNTRYLNILSMNTSPGLTDETGKILIPTILNAPSRLYNHSNQRVTIDYTVMINTSGVPYIFAKCHPYHMYGFDPGKTTFPCNYIIGCI